MIVEERKVLGRAASLWAGGKQVKVTVSDRVTVANASEDRKGGLRIQLNGSQPYYVFTHEVGHLRYSSFDFEKMRDIGADSDTLQLANVFEDIRVNKLIDRDMGIGQVDAWVRDLTKIQQDYKSAEHDGEYDARLKRMFMLAMAIVGIELPRYEDTELIRSIYAHFAHRIDEVVSGEDRLAAVVLAVEVGPYLFGGGQASKWIVTDHLTPLMERVEGEGEGEAIGDPVVVTGEEPPPPSETLPPPETLPPEPLSPPEPLPPLEESEMEEVTSIREEIEEKLTEKLEEIEERESIERGSYVVGESEHANIVTPISEDTVELPERYRMKLDQFQSSVKSESVWGRRGKPTNKIWRLKYGHMGVFKEKPVTKGDLVVLVDMSGSMGCACPRCTRGSYRSNGSAAAAWNAATMITTAFPEARTFGFSSSYEQCYIAPIGNGMMPWCRVDGKNKSHPHRELTHAGGNSDCAALLFLKSTIGSGYAVIVSDGHPNNPSPMSNEHLISHTKALAQSYHRDGMKFGSIVVGNHHNDIYPAEMTAKGEDPDQIVAMMQWLVEERGG